MDLAQFAQGKEKTAAGFYLQCSVEGYLGLPGSGKSYTMGADAYILRERFPMMPVYTNIELNLPGNGPIYVMDDWEDLVNAENGLVILDEVNLWIQARVWAKVPGALLWKRAQVRKSGLKVLWTAQSHKRVDTVLRELTFHTHVCKSWKRLGFFFVRSYGGVLGEPEGFRIVPFINKYKNVYETHEYVKLPAFLQGMGSTKFMQEKGAVSRV
ncbi:hypothetical protein JCM15765_38950 [Paradesulfitobacterium aromaticivorans]